jgi:hypothetical protein
VSYRCTGSSQRPFDSFVLIGWRFGPRNKKIYASRYYRELAWILINKMLLNLFVNLSV